VLLSPDEVLTAAHVVYSSDYGTASNIVVAPAYSYGDEPFGSSTAAYFHYMEIQNPGDTISFFESQFDYAVIHLSTPFTGLGAMGLESNFTGGYVHVTGYPGSADGGIIDSQQYVTKDRTYTLLDGASIGAGSSGGPVWTTNGAGGPEVVGTVRAELPLEGAVISLR
jgi:V8-like Glu-specific endopeptidase